MKIGKSTVHWRLMPTLTLILMLISYEHERLYVVMHGGSRSNDFVFYLKKTETQTTVSSGSRKNRP